MNKLANYMLQKQQNDKVPKDLDHSNLKQNVCSASPVKLAHGYIWYMVSF